MRSLFLVGRHEVVGFQAGLDFRFTPWQAILIEQKNGALEETLDGLVKHYTGKTKGVARQIHRSLASLQSRFQQGHAGQHLALDYLL